MTSGASPAVVPGDVVVDEGSGRVGEVTGCGDDRLLLRPVLGGREWGADPDRVRPATLAERLHAAVAAVNAVSRGERL